MAYFFIHRYQTQQTVYEYVRLKGGAKCENSQRKLGFIKNTLCYLRRDQFMMMEVIYVWGFSSRLRRNVSDSCKNDHLSNIGGESQEL